MAVVAQEREGARWAFVKGSEEAVAPLATRVLLREGERPLDEAARASLLQRAAGLGSSGFRMLALAYRRLAAGEAASSAEEELVWAGLVGLIDPPRAGVKEDAFWTRSSRPALRVGYSRAPRDRPGARPQNSRDAARPPARFALAPPAMTR